MRYGSAISASNSSSVAPLARFLAGVLPLRVVGPARLLAREAPAMPVSLHPHSHTHVAHRQHISINTVQAMDTLRTTLQAHTAKASEKRRYHRKKFPLRMTPARYAREVAAVEAMNKRLQDEKFIEFKMACDNGEAGGCNGLGEWYAVRDL